MPIYAEVKGMVKKSLLAELDKTEQAKSWISKFQTQPQLNQSSHLTNYRKDLKSFDAIFDLSAWFGNSGKSKFLRVTLQLLNIWWE